MHSAVIAPLSIKLRCERVNGELAYRGTWFLGAHSAANFNIIEIAVPTNLFQEYYMESIPSTSNKNAAQIANQLGDAATDAIDTGKSVGRQINAAAHEEIANLKADFDDLVERLPHLSAEDLTAAKEKLFEQIKAAQASARDIAKVVGEKVNYGIDVTSDYVKDRPFQSLAVAAGVGALVGFLISRK
jgi:ElaB/YqjD/DUF883 family membrane-anchored ribosome-binding protein